MFNFTSIYDVENIEMKIGESTTDRFNKEKIDKIIKDNNIKNFRIWFEEDWGWDEGVLNVEKLNEFQITNNNYHLAGIDGSNWATPIIFDTDSEILYYI